MINVFLYLSFSLPCFSKEVHFVAQPSLYTSYMFVSLSIFSDDLIFLF